MDRPILFKSNVRLVINGFPQNGKKPPKNFRANGNGDGRAGIMHLGIALQAIGRTERNGPHPLGAKMPRHLKNEIPFLPLYLKRI